MTLDKEEHRAMLLELIARAHFTGAVAREVVDLIDAIEKAETPLQTGDGGALKAGARKRARA